jgi:hypothetical protein
VRIKGEVALAGSYLEGDIYDCAQKPGSKWARVVKRVDSVIGIYEGSLGNIFRE